ncbi:CU044_5270 family protein [Actinomadura welshii]
MDELQTIREAYGEPAPPTLREMTAARARMFEEPPRRRARRGWRLKAGFGLVAAGAAVAVAIAATGSGTPATPPASPDLGKQAVLAAAERAEAQPTGDFWFYHGTMGRSSMVRSETGDYAIAAAAEEYFLRVGAEPGAGLGTYNRDLPSRPLTAQDEALWKKAGSPSEFKVWDSGRRITYDQGVTRWHFWDPAREGDGGWVGGRTFEEAERLPTDPGELADWLSTGNLYFHLRTPEEQERIKKERGIPEPRSVTPLDKLTLVSALLQTSPMPPAFRAGLMRALAAQPGVKAIDGVTDRLGREGVALAVDLKTTRVTAAHGAPAEERGDYDSRKEIVFDERTGEMLAVQTVLTRPGGPYRDREPGFVVQFRLALDSGWTDTKPSPPEELPF